LNWFAPLFLIYFLKVTFFFSALNSGEYFEIVFFGGVIGVGIILYLIQANRFNKIAKAIKMMEEVNSL
jgi:hypothetical protein